MSTERRISRIFLISITGFVITTALSIQTACTPDYVEWSMLDTAATDTGSTTNVGGDGNAIHLPLPAGEAKQCTQGAGGSYSHSGDATRHDIDLDTSNSIQEELYAPAGGVVYVHDSSASSGFGYHVNIDMGTGQFVTVCHLSEIFVQDGQEVTAGTLIGHEGCTGNCSGDHVHVGLHEGSAAQDATESTSVEATYRAADATEYGELTTIAGDDFVCGLTSEGDPQEGHFYESGLPVPMWHPDGTLIKTPDNAQVYVLEDGNLSWIQDEDVFWSLNYSFDEVVLISDEELGCYGDAEAYSEVSMIDAAYDTDGQLWLAVGVEDDSARYRVKVRETAWESVLASWGLSYTASAPPTTSDSIEDWPEVGVTTGFRSGTLVTETSTSDVYAIDGDDALPIANWDVYLLMGFAHRTVLQVDDDVVATLHTKGSCATDVGCIDQDAVTTCGGGMDLGSSESGGAFDKETESENDADTGTGDETDSQDDAGESTDEHTDDESSSEEQADTGAGSAGEDTGDTADPTSVCAEDACIVDIDGDGLTETLMMVDNAWTGSSVDGQPAFVYANGGCYDGTLSTDDLVYATDGYYRVDFSAFTGSCTADLTLIASTGTDGSSPQSDMSNWYWWQNASFCAGGSSLCDLQDNGVSWEEWLLSVSWDLGTGLNAVGNGYTSNSQL